MRSKRSDIPSSELVRNIIFLGATGSGKSTTCNTLYGNSNGPFPVGHDEVSCTSTIIDHVFESKRIRLIDTPGLGDNRFNERKVEGILRGLTAIFGDPRVDSTMQVDAFVLVVKMNPRGQSLKEDLEEIRSLFGTRALKSLILLVIPRKNIESQNFLPKLRKMEEAVEIVRKAKQEEPNEGWYCLWDNMNPRPGQEEELLGKIQKLEPYTYEAFIGADREARQIAERRIRSKVDKEARNKERSSESDDEKMPKSYLKEFEEKIDKERRELMRARDQALENVVQVVKAMEEMNEKTKAGLDHLFGYLALERDASMRKFMDLLKAREVGYERQLDDFLRQNREILNMFESRIGEKVTKNEDAEENKKVGDKITKILGIEKPDDKKEKEEAIKMTAKKQVETIAKTGVEEAKNKVQQTATEAAKEVAKTGLKAAARRACNIF